MLEIGLDSVLGDEAIDDLLRYFDNLTAAVAVVLDVGAYYWLYRVDVELLPLLCVDLLQYSLHSVLVSSASSLAVRFFHIQVHHYHCNSPLLHLPQRPFEPYLHLDHQKKPGLMVLVVSQ